ncbi:MAG: hypothetical protein JKY99_04780 [Rhizobiales bacterium]|nr:hypothetical protein [Hyphomicrobiales bacterium]
MSHNIDLNAAVSEGIIDPDQAAALATFSNSGVIQTVADVNAAAIDREPFRLTGGFNDIFVTIGIVLLLTGAAVTMHAIYDGPNLYKFAGMGVLIWLLAEYISRVKHMKLPSTVLALGFLFCVNAILQIWLDGQYNFAEPDNVLSALVLLDQGQSAGLITFSTNLGIAVLYFWRFRVPVEAAIMAVAATGLVTVGASELFMDEVARGQVKISDLSDMIMLMEKLLVLPLICGLLIFATGIYLDFRDRNRLSTMSDSAFWLHLISAPMIIHPLFILSSGAEIGVLAIEPELLASVGLALIMTIVVLISLAIDRRALLIPTLAYLTGLGVYWIFETGANTSGIPPFALILLAAGILVIIFGVGWQRIRAATILKILPASWVAALPPVRI